MLVSWCEAQLRRGKAGMLSGFTYMQGTVPRKVVATAGASASAAQQRTDKWRAGKGREVLQYGVFYDYAAHRIAAANPVEPMPLELSALAEQLCTAGVVPPSWKFDSAIINFYERGDCIPPHVDHEHYPRPFCAVSLCAEAPILFGSAAAGSPNAIVPTGTGDFDAPFSLPLPVGSVIVFQVALPITQPPTPMPLKGGFPRCH